MAINIKDEATDRLARELAHETGESITEAVRISMQQRLDRVRRQSRRQGRTERLQAFIDRARARPMLDPREAEEILGYNDDGLPR